jgi:hypothetical protein
MAEFSDFPRVTLIGWLLRSFGVIVLWLCALALIITLMAAWMALDNVVVHGSTSSPRTVNDSTSLTGTAA